MMRECWKLAPDDRPPFKQINKNTSVYTGQIAGYLELGFNPFSVGKNVPRVEEEQLKDEVDEAVSAELSK